jgi:hypothetical protein
MLVSIFGLPGFYFLQELEIFLFSTASRTALGPPSYPTGTGGFLPGWGVKLTTHFQLVPWSRMVELYHRSSTLLYGVMLI